MLDKINLTILEIIAIILATVHFGIPLAYYYYVKKKWLPRPWNIKIDPSYKPKVTIIIPTYNEAEYIQQKLDNIYEQNYSKDKLEIIVVDSASNDGTPQLVKEWNQKHSDLKLRLIEEPVRRGMNPALNYALKHVSSDTEIIIFTDTDAFWEKDTLKYVLKYFADTKVGAVTTNILPLEGKGDNHLEEIYRSHYNIFRVAESKRHSTPIHNGALIAYRRKLIEKIGGIPTYTGNNDSTPASLIAFMGYRAIQINDTVIKEPIRGKGAIRKIRRAQHLILHFLYTKKYAKKLGIYRKTQFDGIWKIEFYLHIINPWLLVISSILFIMSAIMRNFISIIIVSIGLILQTHKTFRTWIVTQLYLILATIRNLWNKDLIWNK